MDPRPYHYQYRKPRFSNPTFQSNNLYQSIYHTGSYTKATTPYSEKVGNDASVPQFSARYKVNPQNQKVSENHNNAKIDHEVDMWVQNGKINQMVNKRYQQPKYPAEKPLQNNKDYHYQNEYERLSRSLIMNNRDRNQAQGQRNINNNNLNNPKNERYPQQANRQNSNMGGDEIKPMYRKSENRAASEMKVYSQDKQRNGYWGEQGQISNYGSRLMKPIPGSYQDYIYQKQQKPYNIISYYPKKQENKHRIYPKLTLENRLIETGQFPFQYGNPETQGY